MPKFCPISANDYYPEVRTNCLAFALGLSHDDDYNLNDELPIAEAFIQAWNRLVGGEIRQIRSIDEAKPNEYIFKVYDYTPFRQWQPILEYYVTYKDFHVVRRELDGTWVHKPGWNEPPTEITSKEDWDELSKEFGSKYVLFAAKSEEAV